MSSFHAAFGLNKWHKIFMFALQGESFELENVLSDFKTCRLFYWCVLFVKSRQTLNIEATVVMTRTELWWSQEMEE